MEEIQATMTAILDRVTQLDTKLTTVSNNLTMEITMLKTEIQQYKVEISTKVNKLSGKITSIKESQTFISKSFEDNKKVTETIIKKNTMLEQEGVKMQSTIKSLQASLKEERAARNENAQYIRSSWQLELSGIPTLENEDSLKLVEKIARLAKIENFSVDQVDVAHRISGKELSPIIVMFHQEERQTKLLFSKKETKMSAHKSANDRKWEISGQRPGKRTEHLCLHE